MARIFAAFIRHGQFDKAQGVPSAHLPHPLTAAGEAEARGIAGPVLDFVEAEGIELWSVIHSSSLLRAYQTAELAVESLLERTGRSMTIRQADALAERSLGAMANLPTDAIERIVARDPRYEPLSPGWKREPEVRLPYLGAESLLEAGERVARYVDEQVTALAAEATADYLILFVGHGGAFRHAALALGLLSRQQVTALSMFHCYPVFIERLTEGTYVQVGGAWKPRKAGGRSVD